MKYIYIIILGIIGAFGCSNGYSQGTIQWNQILGETTRAYYDSTVTSGDQLILNVHETKTLSAELNDTSGIAQVRVKLGSQAAGSDLFVQTFSFSGQQLNELVWFQRTGIICRFGLGEFVNMTQSHLTLEALSSSGAVLGTYSGMLY
jgi:hypothetical protein